MTPTFPVLAWPVRKVGITGGIASGKSTVAALLRGLGLPVLDLDQVSRDVVMPGRPTLARVVEAFGTEVLMPDGSLDRRALGRRVVSDPEARRLLESLLHPPIFEETAAWMNAIGAHGTRSAGVEATLLAETGFWRWFDVVVVVNCSPEVQVQRVRTRNGFSEAEATRWLAAQASTNERLRVADVIIDNSGSPADLERAVAAAWPRIQLSR